MTRIDFHVHADSDRAEDLAVLAQTCRELDCYACLSGGPRYGSNDYLPNEEVLKICRDYPEFIPLAKLDLWESADPSEVYRYAEMGAKGFKCIYPWYEYDHDIYMPVYEAAQECGLPILFHTGNFRPSPADEIYRRPMLKNMHPINLDRIARSFPRLNIVMAHLGTRIFHDEASHYIKVHSNLYADFAGFGQWARIQPQDLAKIVSSEGTVIDPEMKAARKIIFGSDAYVTRPQTMVQGMQHYDRLLRRTGVPDTVIREIMGGTVARWLGVELDN
jgi:predicted TIM-barrel fold metal-dependent hydrolase